MKKTIRTLLYILVLLNVLTCGVYANEIETEVISKANTDPRVVIEKYVIEGGSLVTGQTNLLTVYLSNMNKNTSVNSLVATTTFSTKEAFVEYGVSNQKYVEQIKAGQMVAIKIPIRVEETLSVNFITCVIDLKYTSSMDGKVYSDSSKLYIPREQEKLSVYRTDFPNTAIVDEDARASIIFENASTLDIYNVTMTVKGSAMEDKVIQLGTLQSGKRKNEEVYISFISEGEQYVSVEFSYMDAVGNESRVQSQSQRVDVSSAVAEEEEEYEIETVTDRSMLSKQVIYGLGIMITAIIMIVVIAKKNNKR